MLDLREFLLLTIVNKMCSVIIATIIILFLCGSIVLERTFADSHMGRFLIVFRHLVGLLWTSGAG
jgi:hypothetical protein